MHLVVNREAEWQGNNLFSGRIEVTEYIEAAIVNL